MQRRACIRNGLTVGAVAAERAGSCSDQQHWQQRRHDGHCKHGPDITGKPAHQHQREQRTPDGADGSQSLAQAIGRAPDALADAIQEAGAEHGGGAIGKWKERLGQRCQAIAQDRQAFALAQMVAQYPEKTLATAAVASAMPSISPTVITEVPNVTTRNTNSRLWIVSD